jgi:hypothetical protein
LAEPHGAPAPTVQKRPSPLLRSPPQPAAPHTAAATMTIPARFEVTGRRYPSDGSW